jgi:hypothetical protein
MYQSASFRQRTSIALVVTSAILLAGVPLAHAQEAHPMPRPRPPAEDILSGTVRIHTLSSDAARAELVRRGLVPVSRLERDRFGVWRATARERGRIIDVTVDPHGVVSTDR